MFIERTITDLATRNHAITAVRAVRFLEACLDRLGVPKAPELHTNFRELMFLLLSLRALRPERSIELQALEQNLVLRLEYEPLPIACLDQSWEVPDLVPLPEHAERPRLTLYLHPPYSKHPDILQRVQELQGSLPVSLDVQTRLPATTLPLLLQPLSALEEILWNMEHSLPCSGRESLCDDLRQWQREEAFRGFTLSLDPALAVLPLEITGQAGEVAAFLGSTGTPRIGVILVPPCTERTGWQEDPTTSYQRYWGPEGPSESFQWPTDARHLVWKADPAPITWGRT